MTLTVIILTKNEATHIARAIRSIRDLGARILVVDSGSDDDTVHLAKSAGAEVLMHPWQGYARQFNWALSQVAQETDWVLRLDADEIADDKLVRSIKHAVKTASDEIAGYTLDRYMTFQGQRIRFGGVFPVRILRLFRPETGHCENRWMDEHIVVDGRIDHLDGALIDDNQKPLSWWTEKHNQYANREALDLLLPAQDAQSSHLGQSAATKRWIKQNIYARLPPGGRAFLYFLYRYVVRLGFLDGRSGAAFHVLQGFWYRYLVDAKIDEVRRRMTRDELSIEEAVLEVLSIDMAAERPA